MEAIIGKNAAIGYNPKDWSRVYFNSDGKLGVIEIKTLGVALGMLGILSLAFIPFPFGLIGLGAGLVAIGFSFRRLGDIKSLNEFDKIDPSKNVEKEGLLKGTLKTAAQGLKAAQKVANETVSHASSALNAFANVRWKVIRNIFEKKAIA
jgi:hypothetical protein